VVDSPGAYNVSVTDANGCSVISQSIVVAYENLDPAGIVYNGSLQICETQPITLSATEGASYLWSTGETTQVIEVSQSGTYTVEVIGVCGAQTSPPVEIIAETAPEPPVITDNSLEGTEGDSFTFNASGSGTIFWYDSPTSMNPVGEGSSYTTNPINTNSSFWVSNANVVPGEMAEGGKDAWTENGDGQYQNNSNYYLTFDAHADITISSVEVYAQGTANRTIAVEDAGGNTVASATVSIPDGPSTVLLGLQVPQGTGYSLRLTGNNPLLWRDKDLVNGFAYPFEVGSLATITGTNVNGADFDNYYYYFYNWVLEGADAICESERVEVTATVGLNEKMTQGISLYPNPVNDNLTIQFPSDLAYENIVIRDQFGKSIHSSSCKGLSFLNLDCTQYASGVYMIEISGQHHRYSEKFLVK